ncbi:MAG TPA: FAD-dependent monooxygenase [Terriglobia bacterium]|nr:FAD-dependent monooxygenase [Terriglobia bacterium]
MKTDVLIAGAGPAGLAAAIALRQKGFEVVTADPAHPPIDKACGEGVMPEGIRALTALGVAIDPRASFPLRGIRFLRGSVAVEAAFPRGRGAGIRRTALYRALLHRATEAGVVMLWGAQLRAHAGEPVSVGGRPVQCRWLVGADGQNSQVRQWAGLGRARPVATRFGFRRHYQTEPWSDSVEVYWGKHGQMFVTPVGPTEVCIALLTRHPQARVANQLPLFPEVARRLKDAKPTSSERGGITVSRSLRAVCRGYTALVGDASGSVDAITGDGLCLGFQQAVALAQAIERNDLALYQAAHRKIMNTPALMARLMLALDRHPWLQRRALRGLAGEPWLFSRLLAVHLGAAAPAAFGLRGVLTLGWKLLRA